MGSITARERISVLLNLLGKDVTDALLGELPKEIGGFLEAELQRLRENPPDDDDIDDVLDEFLRVVTIASNADANGNSGAVTLGSAGNGDEEDLSPSAIYLRELPPPQLVAAFRGESPRTVAIVLNTLPEGLAAQSLEALPDDQRDGVFTQMKLRPKVSKILVERLIEATADKARAIRPNELKADAEDANGRLARVLKTMRRKNREQILAGLEQRDPETATAIRMSLYAFTDLPTLTDKSLQKLLAALDQRTLSAGLVRADVAIMECVKANLSRRAREVLKEEMDLMGTSVDEEAIQEARRQIMTAVVELDQKGELAFREG